MKMHPFLVIGVILVSAGAGYYFRSSFPGPLTPLTPLTPAPPDDALSGEDGSPLGPEPATAAPRRSLAAIEAENDIRRMVEQREAALLGNAADEEPAPIEREPMVVEKVSSAPFYDELAPHGEWLEAGDYGDVWQPSYAHDSDWRPYVDGGWAYTEAGWTWDSDEPGGDITCHYGRWVNLVDCGWCWVPGYDWAPAWVSWRCSDEVIGWAPLPPCVPWKPASGIGSWVDACGDLGPGSYCFVPIRHFAAANCRPVLCARAENANHFGSTRNLTRLVCKPAAGLPSCPVLEGPNPHRITTLGVKDLRHRHLKFAEAVEPRSPKTADREMLSVRRLAFSAAAGVSGGSAKASRRLAHVTVASPWEEAGNPQTIAAARRQVFAEATQSFRGLPRLVRTVEAAKPSAPRAQLEPAKVARTAVIESLRPQRTPARPDRTPNLTSGKTVLGNQAEQSASISEALRPVVKDVTPSVTRPRAALGSGPESRSTPVVQTRESSLAPAKLEPARSLQPSKQIASAPSPALRQAARDRTSTRGAERLAARAALEQEERERLRRLQAIEAQAVEQQRQQSPWWQPRQQPAQEQAQEQAQAQAQAQAQQQAHQQAEQQAEQRQVPIAQQQKDERGRRAAEFQARQAKQQAMAEQQHHQAEAERHAIAENQRRQAEARQQQELEQRQHMEQARQQAMAEARRQEEAQQRAQMEQARREAELQSRHMAEQRQRENEARQQAEAHRRQAEENQRRQQVHEAQERAQAARQQQQEESHRQAEASRHREQEAARHQGGHGQEKGRR